MAIRRETEKRKGDQGVLSLGPRELHFVGLKSTRAGQRVESFRNVVRKPAEPEKGSIDFFCRYPKGKAPRKQAGSAGNGADTL